jgi:hypothetical protein
MIDFDMSNVSKMEDNLIYIYESYKTNIFIDMIK